MIISDEFVKISEKSCFYLNYTAIRKRAEVLKIPHTRIAKILDIKKTTLSSYMNKHFKMENGDEKWEQTIGNRMMEEFGPAAIRDMYEYFQMINVPMAEYKKFTKYLLYIVATGQIYDKRYNGKYYSERIKEIIEDLYIALKAKAELKNITNEDISRETTVVNVINNVDTNVFDDMVGYFFDIANFPYHGQYIIDNIPMDGITIKDIEQSIEKGKKVEVRLKTIQPQWYQDHFTKILNANTDNIVQADGAEYRTRYNNKLATDIIDTVSETYFERVISKYEETMRLSSKENKHDVLEKIKNDLSSEIGGEFFKNKIYEGLKYNEYNYRVMYNKILAADILNSLYYQFINDIKKEYKNISGSEFPISSDKLDAIINEKISYKLDKSSVYGLIEEKPLGEYEFYYTISEQAPMITSSTQKELNRKYRRCLFGYIAKELSEDDIKYFLRILLFSRGFNDENKQKQLKKYVDIEKSQYEEDIGQAFERNKIYHLASELHCVPQYLIGTSDKTDWGYGVIKNSLNPFYKPIWYFEKEGAETAGKRLDDILPSDSKEIVQMFETLSKPNRNKLLNYMKKEYKRLYEESEEIKQSRKETAMALEERRAKARNRTKKDTAE